MEEAFINNEKSKEYFKKADNLYAESGHMKWIDLVVKKAEGSIVTDIDGNEFIDLHGNGSCANVGHSHPKVREAIKKQTDQLIHYCPGYFYHDQIIDTVNTIIASTPGDFEKKVVFGNSGSDANDGIIKYARGYTGRNIIISFNGAYHGTTYGALSVSACTQAMRRQVSPLLPDVYFVPFPNMYRAAEGETEHDVTERFWRYFEEALNNYIPLEDIAGVIIEPIQGDAGMIKPPKEYVQRIAAFCKENGIVFAVDEINQGLGRSGKMWAIEHFDVVPDLISTAKSLANGLPLSAVVGRKEILDTLEPPAHIFTTAGNPIACAASQAVFEIIEEEGLVEKSRVDGEYARSRFEEIQAKHPVIGDVRIYGLNGGIELVKDPHTKEPDRESTNKITKYLHERGVIMLTLAANVLRFQPPLTISREELDKAFEILEDAFDALAAGEIELDESEHMGW